MFVRFTLTSDGKVVSKEESHPCEDQPGMILRGILLEWQSSSDTRQAIIGNKEIPVHHSSSNGVQVIHYELEGQDLRDLFELFRKNRRVCVEEGCSEEEMERGLAELKAVYGMLKKRVAV